MTDQFHRSIRISLGNPSLQSALDINAQRRYEARHSALASLPEDWHVMRQKAHDVRARVIDNLDSYLTEFMQHAQDNGFLVYQAETADDAVGLVEQVLLKNNARRIAKSKSMLSEEINLNHALENKGFQVVETDLGEYIIQLRGERPAHIITPSVHLRRQEVAETFHEKLGIPYTEDIAELTEAARKTLRKVFLTADAGISGVNFGVAQEGMVCLVTNEGNGRMVTTLPPVHIALMGIERLVPTLEDLSLMLHLLPRSATGQKMSVYTSLIRGPSRVPGVNPQQRYLILVNNGRRALQRSMLKDALYCIRCGACLNACPVFREIGGHAYVNTLGEGSPYPGPIGAVISPGMFGYSEFGHLARASSLCGACKETCPVDIDLPQLLLQVRAGEIDQTDQTKTSPNPPGSLTLGLRLYTWLATNPVRFSYAQHIAGRLTRLVSKSAWIRLPAFSGWGYSKDMPKPASQTFRSRFPQITSSMVVTSPDPALDTERGPSDDESPSAMGKVLLPTKIEQFETEIRLLGGSFTRCKTNNLTASVLTLLREYEVTLVYAWSQEFLPPGLIESLRNAGLRITNSLDPDAGAGLTGAIAAVSATGTLVLCEHPGQPLAASLLPPIHVAIFHEDILLRSLEDAFQMPTVRQAPATVLISGPSRTADIEMSLTIGVHGPGKMHVFCLQDSQYQE